MQEMVRGHLDMQTPRKELKYNVQQSISDKIQGVWIADETQVF